MVWIMQWCFVKSVMLTPVLTVIQIIKAQNLLAKKPRKKHLNVLETSVNVLKGPVVYKEVTHGSK